MEGTQVSSSSTTWHFDPLSPDLLFSNNKVLTFSTLNLNPSSMSPFDLNLASSSTSETETTSSSPTNSEPSVGDGQLVNVSFLTLDPLIEPCESQENKLQILTSTSNVQNNHLPELNQVQIINDNDEHNLKEEEEDVDAIYFSIQDLDQYDRDDKGYLIEDIMGECEPPPTSTFESRTLNVDLLDLNEGDDEDHETNSHSHSHSNSFDMDEPLNMDDDKEDEQEEYPDPDIDTDLKEQEQEQDGDKQELKCKFCGFICCSKSSLGIHERRHTGERPYSCKYCGRLFNSAQCCKHHERLHTGDKPFECQYCGKKYAVSTRLKRHERVHTREEPYKCSEPGCGKTFRWFDAFRDHRNTHNGVPLYLCSVCGKSFTSYLKFYYHERGHFLKRERDKDRDRQKKLQTQGQGKGQGQGQGQLPSKDKDKDKNKTGNTRGKRTKKNKA